MENAIKVIFKTEEEIVDFVRKVSKYPCDIDLRLGRNIIDAKSILGVFYLGTGNILELLIHEENQEEIRKEIEEYRVEAVLV